MMPLPEHAVRWVSTLGLVPHPEGGFFRESYGAAETIAHAHLPARFSGSRRFSTAIYFLLAGDDYSALHRLQADELWHLYDGGPLTLHVIDESSGEARQLHLGTDADAGQRPQLAVQAGWWFGATLDAGVEFALLGCTVAPGFRYDDFELGTRADLLRRFPQHRALITRLTREPRED